MRNIDNELSLTSINFVSNNLKILINTKSNIQNYRYNRIIRINKQYFFIFISKKKIWCLYSIQLCKIIRIISPYLVKYLSLKKDKSFMIRPFIYFTRVDQHEDSILATKISSNYSINSFNQITNVDTQFKNYLPTYFFI